MTLLSAAAESLSLASAPGDFFWSADMFKKDTWEGLMKGTRVFLTLVGALLLIYEMRSERMGEPVEEKTKRWVAYIMTILAFGVYFDYGNPNTRYSEYYHRHEFYHYYLGSKFFKEVGYQRLYECTAIAEVELGRRSQIEKREIRDLRVNLIKPMAATYVLKDPAQCKSHFAPERWDSFKKDVEWFYKSAAGTYWESMMKDHGYNPPPVWTMTGKFFGSFGPASDHYFKVLSSIDVLFHLGTVLLFGWAFGWRAMAVATIFWGCNAPANFYWTGGAFLRQDWIFFLIASLCCAKKHKFVLAGAFLMWSSLLRIFPVILFFGWGIIMGLYLLDRLRDRGSIRSVKDLLHPSHWRVLAGAAIAVAVLVPASMAVAGKDSYKQFYEHTLKTHQGTPLTNHMGLETMLVHDWSSRMRFMRDDNLDDPFQSWKQGRLDRFKARKPIFFAIVAFIGLWSVWALRRTKLLWIAIPLSVPMLMCLTNLTCYYYSFFMTVAALVTVRRQLGPAILATSGASTILLYSPSGYYWVDDRFTAQTYLFAALALLVLYAYSRPFSIERLKAWWEKRPEPRPKALPPSEPAPAA
ncbi:MAG TPA: glycosyltransferase family 87 protein [Polyangiaceae bacterium]|nr:glycosyltransferase family 87 protein [Polyangiaceae bacterium]